jgi:VanZ family protein
MTPSRAKERAMLLRRLLVALCWLTALGAYALAIMPSDQTVSVSSWDKMNHMIAFFVLAILARAAYPRVRAWTLFAALSAFGGFIELSQAIPALHRDAEWADLFADMAAAAVGLAVATPLAWWLNRGRGASASDAI